MLISNHQVKDNNRTFIYLLFVALISFGFSKAIAATSDGDWQYVSDDVKETCNSLKNSSIPLQDMPSDAIKSSYKKCDSEELYFGFKNSPDYFKARNCAIINHHYDILTMIYANGSGVEANLDLAIHFACLFGGAGAEIEGRIKHLTKLKKQKNPKKDFNICDDITSGYMMGVCAGYAQEESVEEQRKHLKALNLSLKPDEQEQLSKLLVASTLYFDARIDNEMDGSGTGAQGFMILETMRLNRKMIKLIDKAMQCKVTSQTSEQYQTADNELNMLYKKTQKKRDQEFSSFSRKGTKITERAWIKYKNAWVNFGLTKCPKITKETWETLITKDRITQLKEQVGYEH